MNSVIHVNNPNLPVDLLTVLLTWFVSYKPYTPQPPPPPTDQAVETKNNNIKVRNTLLKGDRPTEARRPFYRDEYGRFNTIGQFQFALLPIEIQQKVLIEIAVARQLAVDTFDEVYEDMGRVCKLWKNMIDALLFLEKVKERVFRRG